jgi:hypothetical protein
MRRAHGIAVAALGGGVVIVWSACGGDIATSTSTSTAPQCVPSPPPDPGGTATPPNGTIAFAIRKLYVGDTDRSGTPSQSAWRSFGYDIDGRAATADTPGLCVLNDGASKSTHIDGECGIDNSFGANILPLVLTTWPDFAAKIEASVAAGGFTDLIVLDASALTTSGALAPATFVNGATLGHAPAWDGSDAWPLDSASFVDAGAPGARVTFARGYASGGTWVGTPRSGRGTITFGTFMRFPFRIPVDRMLVSMRISPDGGAATDGVISGVVPVDAFIAMQKIWAGLISTSLCSGGEVSIDEQVRQPADILVDGTQDPSRRCDGISIGLGFEASAVRLGPIVDLPVPPDLCATDAGSADAADAGGG